MSQQEELQKKLRAGIDAAKNGDRATARRLLEQVIDIDENNEMAWIWLASSVNTVAERRECLERVLVINPGNTRAREALSRLAEESPTGRGGAGAGASSSSTSDQARLREQINRVRQVQNTSPVVTDTQNRTPLVSYLIVGALILVLLGFGAAMISFINANTIAALPTEVAAQPTASDTPTETRLRPSHPRRRTAAPARSRASSRPRCRRPSRRPSRLRPAARRFRRRLRSAWRTLRCSIPA